MWDTLNKNGKTVFIEDNIEWYDLILNQHKHLDIRLVQYNTKRRDYLKLLDTPQSLNLNLDFDLIETNWDIIFVDGPLGNIDDSPGRMKSIYTASFLALSSDSTYVYVHDCNRDTEKIYCDRYLPKESLVFTTFKLRKYYIT